MEKVSVIIPCYNVEHEIDRLMECIKMQTIGIENLEIIMVNDGSTDRTASKLVSWEEQYEENILLVYCEQNSGMSYARNIALDAASGDYIAFIDADDWIAPDYIRRLLEMCMKYNSDIAICRHDRLSVFKKENNKITAKGKEYNYTFENIDEKRQFLVSHVLSTSVWGRLYKRSFIEEHQLRFPVGVHYEDTYFCYMSYMYAEAVSKCDDIMYHYYRNPYGTVLGGSEQDRRERLTTLRMFYGECVCNNWLEKFYAEIELVFIQKYYVEMLEVMFRTFETVDYPVYCGIRDWLSAHFPDFNQNPYLSGSCNELDKLLLRCITEDFNIQQLDALRKSFLNIIYQKDRPDTFCKKNFVEKQLPQKEEFFLLLEELCTNPGNDKFIEIKELLSIVPLEATDKEIHETAMNTEGMLPGMVYSYITGREIFISYLKDTLKRDTSNIPYGKPDICQKILKEYICIP